MTAEPSPQRIEWLKGEAPGKGDHVVYWMQQSQRAHCNHALAFAIQQANELKKPLWVLFGLTPSYPEANARHYAFMLDGLRQTQADLAERDVRLVVRLGEPGKLAIEASRDATLVVCDRGYLRHQRQWRESLARGSAAPVVQIESDVVVPVETVSDKQEYAARTIRPKINRLRDAFLQTIQPEQLKRSAFDLALPDSLDLSDPPAIVASLPVDQSVRPVPLWRAGYDAATRELRQFVSHRLQHYVEHGKQPETDDVSRMSVYLHFGQISPIEVALAVQAAKKAPYEAKEAYLEELIVRRELSCNFTYYNAMYDQYEGLPRWAKATLKQHAGDRREHRYTPAQLDAAQTHDAYWNASMREMKYTGFMHNYMRMYWGKKILEWSATPRRAFQTMLTLNNRYFIDGRDPNSYVGVGWVFGLHDRPWQERDIFGQVRYMNAAGLERKCNPQQYIVKVDRLVKQVQRPRT